MTQHDKCIDLEQEAYIDALAEEHGYVNCKAVNSPIEQKVCLTECPEVCDVEKRVQQDFWKINGKLMCLCTHTRPDISHAMNQLTSAEHRATKLELSGYNYMDPEHFTSETETAMEGYGDSSHGDCKATARSSAGHMFFLEKNQISMHRSSGKETAYCRKLLHGKRICHLEQSSTKRVLNEVVHRRTWNLSASSAFQNLRRQ